MSGYETYRQILAIVCFGLLGVAVLYFALDAAGRLFRTLAERVCRRGRIAAVVAAVMTVGLAIYGGSKWRFEYANGVQDNGSYCTNDEIRASWRYDVAAMEYTIRAVYQDLTRTNETGECIDTLHQLPECLVRDGMHVWNVPNATNMRVVVYATYVPPPAVHTNGVYHLGGVMRTMNTTNSIAPKYVTPGVKILVDLSPSGKSVLTPTNAPPFVQRPFATQTQQEQ